MLGGLKILPSDVQIRKTCVSTAKDSRPRQNNRTQLAVLGPIK